MQPDCHAYSNQGTKIQAYNAKKLPKEVDHPWKVKGGVDLRGQ